MELMPQGSPADEGTNTIQPQPGVSGVQGFPLENSGWDATKAAFSLSRETGLNADLQGAQAISDLNGETPRSQFLSPEEAGQKYGVKGALDFDRPVSEGAAAFQNADTMAKLDLQSRVNASSGMVSAVGTTVASFLGSMTDPYNIVAGMVPGLGEERAGAILARAGMGDSALKTAASRLIAGGSAGALGSLAMIPLQDAAVQFDTGIKPSLGDDAAQVGLTALVGGVTHAGVGGLGDLFRYATAGDDGDKAALLAKRGALVSDAIMDPDTQVAMKRAAMARLMDDESPLTPEDIAATDPNIARAQAEVEIPPLEPMKPTDDPQAYGYAEQERESQVQERATQIQQDAANRASAKVSGASQVTEDSSKMPPVEEAQVDGYQPPEDGSEPLGSSEQTAREEDMGKWAEAEANRVDPEGAKQYDEDFSQTAEGGQQALEDAKSDNLKQLYSSAADCIIGNS